MKITRNHRDQLPLFIESKRDSNNPYLYITKHGIGPGTLPSGVNLVKAKDLSNYLTAIWVDAPLTTEGLKTYDIYPETEINKVLSRYGISREEVEGCQNINANDDLDEDILDEAGSRWVRLQRKSVLDYDGMSTDYTMYENIFHIAGMEDPTGEPNYVFVLGDEDLYSPNDGDYDWECDTKEEAYEWFDNYTGPGDADIESSTDITATDNDLSNDNVYRKELRRLQNKGMSTENARQFLDNEYEIQQQNMILSDDYYSESEKQEAQETIDNLTQLNKTLINDTLVDMSDSFSDGIPAWTAHDFMNTVSSIGVSYDTDNTNAQTYLSSQEEVSDSDQDMITGDNDSSNNDSERINDNYLIQLEAACEKKLNSSLNASWNIEENDDNLNLTINNEDKTTDYNIPLSDLKGVIDEDAEYIVGAVEDDYAEDSESIESSEAVEAGFAEDWNSRIVDQAMRDKQAIEDLQNTQDGSTSENISAKFVGGPYDGEIVDHDTLMSMGNGTFTIAWSKLPSHNKALVNTKLEDQPIVDGYLSPMLDDGMLRYETADIYDSLSN